MKTFKQLLYVAAFAALLSACTDKPMVIENANFEKSAAHATCTMDITLPLASSQANTAIREELIKILDDQVCHQTYAEDMTRLFDPFDGDKTDLNAILDYYGTKRLESISKCADEDFSERSGYIQDNEDLTDEEKAEMIENYPGWASDISISKIYESPKLVVFLSQNYEYCGGAHGGVTGAGALTFNKKDGSLFTSFLKDGCVEEIQPMLEEGLLSYFSDADSNASPETLRDYLFESEGIIPLPGETPCPDKGGLRFCYQQYEIAPYAAGMPAFVIPLDKIAPFLTDEAKALLEVK